LSSLISIAGVLDLPLFRTLGDSQKQARRLLSVVGKSEAARTGTVPILDRRRQAASSTMSIISTVPRRQPPPRTAPDPGAAYSPVASSHGDQVRSRDVDMEALPSRNAPLIGQTLGGPPSNKDTPSTSSKGRKSAMDYRASQMRESSCLPVWGVELSRIGDAG
jgi:hypothetical protein